MPHPVQVVLICVETGSSPLRTGAGTRFMQ